jgi:hypothetical protein
MDLKYDFSGWATRNDLVCADGRTIRKGAFKHCDGMSVPIVWNHQHDDVDNILGHAILEERKDGMYAYCFLNETESGKAAKQIVQHGDVHMLSIYANGLKQVPNGNGKDVVHGDIREVSLVVGGANPGAFIDFVDLAHGDGAEQEVIIGTGEAPSLYHSSEKPPLITPKSGEKPKEDPKPTEEPKEDPKPEDKPKEGETVQDVVDSMTEKQRTVMYALIAATAEELGKGSNSGSDKSDKTKGGDNTMKHNVFDREETKDTVLCHAAQGEILALAKQNSVGTFQNALGIYLEQNEELAHGIDNIEALFPEFKDVRPGAPELVTRDQGWVTVVMNKVHKQPFSRIRTRQMDARNDSIRSHGYKKGDKKTASGNMSLVARTTDPQTIYRTEPLNRDDILDITDFDVVEYQYGEMKLNLKEEVAVSIMVGDGRDPGDQHKISEDHIRSIWNDKEIYTIHKDVDLEAAKKELQGTNTGANKYVYSEAVIEAALYAREGYKGTGIPDFYCTPHNLNTMLLARDRNGRKLYNGKADIITALNVKDIYTAEQFDGLIRTDDAGKGHELIGIFVNLEDYTVGCAKGGEITRFEQFDIDFNQNKQMIETRLSGALTRIASAIVLEMPVSEEAA